jgi:hypothetical protein
MNDTKQPTEQPAVVAEIVAELQAEPALVTELAARRRDADLEEVAQGVKGTCLEKHFNVYRNRYRK